MGLGEYNGAAGGGDFADDEKILYRLVPQKKGALVQFDMLLKDGVTAINAGDKMCIRDRCLTFRLQQRR